MTSTTSDRLQLLQEHIRLSLLERKRAFSLKTEPDSRNTHEISRSLDTLHQGIEQLEREQQQLEVAGDLFVPSLCHQGSRITNTKLIGPSRSSQALREREDVLVKLRSQYDDLHAQFTSTDHVPPSAPLDLSFRSSASVISPGRRSENPIDEHEAREALMGSRETPSALRKGNKTVRFSDTLVNTDELDNHQVLQLHRRVIEEQDQSLDRLSESIRNQRELSIQIGDELDSHVQLLDDVDDLVDRHQDRLNGAKKRLNYFAQTAKNNGTCPLRYRSPRNNTLLVYR